jgi:hypothetical protein
VLSPALAVLYSRFLRGLCLRAGSRVRFFWGVGVFLSADSTGAGIGTNRASSCTELSASEACSSPHETAFHTDRCIAMGECALTSNRAQRVIQRTRGQVLLCIRLE